MSASHSSIYIYIHTHLSFFNNKNSPVILKFSMDTQSVPSLRGSTFFFNLRFLVSTLSTVHCIFGTKGLINYDWHHVFQKENINIIPTWNPKQPFINRCLVKQPFPMQRLGIIQLKQPFINGCLGFQAGFLPHSCCFNLYVFYLGVSQLGPRIAVGSKDFKVKTKGGEFFNLTHDGSMEMAYLRTNLP